ncbi:MAG: Hsp70 family protein [Verrucomicrobiota bacterium]
MSKGFSLGIDLGTSNCAMARCDLESGETRVVETPQFIQAGSIGNLDSLPSALYLPREKEFSEGALRLPWAKKPASFIAGTFARQHGSLNPDRLITSAKSWLSNPNADPTADILPWQSETVEEKLSPFESSKLYLEYLGQAFSHQRGGEKPNDGAVVITVPASFDERARQLTQEAAEAAGLKEVILLEEPQAAFYSWAANPANDWRSQVTSGDIVLVCDIGGGTADFSLIAVSEKEGELSLERISVGDHLLLGGDNMDLALAYVVQGQLHEEGVELDEWQFHALIHGCNQAKVALFKDPSLEEAPLALASRGSSLLAQTVSARLDRPSMENMVLEGFFPLTEVTDMPEEQSTAGLQEIGLPYAADPVISKHLARFLTRSLTNVQSSDDLKALVRPESLEGTFLRPNAILFNGGVFNAAPLRQRVLDLLAHWNAGEPVRELAGDHPDLAVARGAAVYGWTRETGEGLRIRAGIARSYYIGLESSMPAVPGLKRPVKALCVVPQGMEEGSDLVIDNQEFGLITGQEAEFRFFSSAVRSGALRGTGIVTFIDR